MKRPYYQLRWTIVVVALVLFAPPQARAANIIDEWGSVKTPPAPALHAVTVDPKTTALLMLDVLHQTCNEKRRPRCVAALPTIKKFLAQARSNKMLVVYTDVPHTSAADIWPEVAPTADEPVVLGILDKFINPDLDKILKAKGIQTVITVGAASNGAVLHTAAGAVQRGFKVIVPVDAVAADNSYIEQYITWDLVNAPVMADKTTLTTTDMIKF
jgi:nicotinamidase-related amidase